jgi:protein-disulfide isomerase
MRSFYKVMATLLIGALIGLPTLATAADAPAPAFTDAQKAAIEDIVRDLLTKKEPDLVIKAAKEMQNRMETESATKSKQAIADNKDRIFNDPNAQIGGNPKGDVTLVEFFDYQCGYCKAVEPTLVKLLQEDKNLKIIYKEYPILGEGSVIASKAALASVKQGKYLKFHEALMSAKEHFTEESVMKIAKDSGLDVEKLKKDMADDNIEKIIRANQLLGNQIEARGTPSFILGDQLLPGALPYEQMKEAISEIRKEAKK